METTREEKLTPLQLAKEIGVSRQRIHDILAEGRIVGVEEVETRTGIRYFIPKDPQILRGSKDREGKLMDYIRDWERRHSVREIDNKAWRATEDGLHD